MATRKKQPKQQSRGVLWFIGILVAVCLAYEPVARKLGVDTGKEGISTVLSRLSEKASGLSEGAGEVTETFSPPPGDPEEDRSEPSKKAVGKPSARPSDPSSSARALPTGNTLLRCAPMKKGVPEKMLYRKGYITSYNQSLKLPNWVAWELTPERLVERESRTDKFLPDPDLPPSQAVTTDDYKRSGWDRGHMCPAGDNRWNWRAMQESFYMTNICPQHHNLNRGDWKELEEACRAWAQVEGSLYIVCGPVLYNQKHRTIGRGHLVTVPEAFFKVVLCTRGTRPKAIGFIFKNTAGNHRLDAYVNSVDEVERITGIDFFPALPDEVERQVEAECNPARWGLAPRKKGR